jgi:diacylglycerol kinase family enzyme
MSSDARIFFLLNAKSGGQGTARVIEGLLNFARTAPDIRVAVLDPANIDQQIAEAHSADTVVIGGGDGTISRLIGNFQTHRRIGFLPLGTGNDLGRELGMPPLPAFFNPQFCVNFFSSLQPKSFALGMLEANNGVKSYFLNYISFGFDGMVVETFSRMRSQGLFLKYRGVWSNRLAYGLAGMRHVAYQIPPGTVLTNLDTAQKLVLSGTKSLVIANIQSMLGLGKSNLESSAEDNLLEAVSVGSLLDYSRMVLGAKISPLSLKPFGSADAWELETFGASNLPVQIDGEPRQDLSATRFRFSIVGRVGILGVN